MGGGAEEKWKFKEAGRRKGEGNNQHNSCGEKREKNCPVVTVTQA